MFKQKTATQQQFRDECNVNSIMRRYTKTGVLPESYNPSSNYKDVSSVPDFMTIKDQMMRAEEAFMNLPVKIRKEFDHDPIQFLQFIANPENKEKAQSLGLLKVPEPEPVDYQKIAAEELQKLNGKKEPAQSPS